MCCRYVFCKCGTGHHFLMRHNIYYVYQLLFCHSVYFDTTTWWHQSLNFSKPTNCGFKLHLELFLGGFVLYDFLKIKMALVLMLHAFFVIFKNIHGNLCPLPPCGQQLLTHSHNYMDFTVRLLLWDLLRNHFINSLLVFIWKEAMREYWMYSAWLYYEQFPFMFICWLQKAHWLRNYDKIIYHVNSLFCCKDSETISTQYLS